MKNLIKANIPSRWVPAARRAYTKIFDRPPRIHHAYGEIEDLDALKCVVSYNKYGGYCVPETSKHRVAAKKVLSGLVYEPATIEYMIANCENRDIIHAGAYFGDFLPALSKSLGPDALIWAFEPNLENFRCAGITLKINDMPNVNLVHAGLGAEKQDLLIQTRHDNGRSLGGVSRIVDVTDNALYKEPIRVVAVDDVIGSERDIGILQLDIEGYEEEALKGAVKTIRRCSPILILEVSPGSTLEGGEWFAQNISSLGYVRVSALHGNIVYRREHGLIAGGA